MPNEFQNRDQMLNSIAQNAANNTPVTPVVEQKETPVYFPNGVPQAGYPSSKVHADPIEKKTQGTIPYTRDDGTISAITYTKADDDKSVGLKPAPVNGPAASTFRGTTESIQTPTIHEVPASEYETMTPPPVSGVNYNMTRADSSWQAPVEQSQTKPDVHTPYLQKDGSWSIPDANMTATPKNETPAQPAATDSGVIVDDDIDMDQFKKEQEAHAAKAAEEYEKKKVQFNITMNDVKATMPSITGDELDKKSLEMMGDLKKYRTNLIVNEGMTPEEADEATHNRMKHLGTKINNEWIDQHPHTGVITVNKEDADKLELTQEEHDKLITTKSIKLVCVENKELETLKVIDAPTVTKDKLQYIRKSNNAGARYSIPLPAFGDYVTFHGATARALMQEGIDKQNESTLQALERKAQFIYDHLIGSSLMNKYNENGVTVLTFDNFCDRFPWFDLDLAIYAIYVASSPETYSGGITCSFCKEQFDYDFHADKMLITDDFPDNIKKSIDDILKNTSGKEGMQKIHDNNMAARLMKSPKTKNVYSLQSPSINKARAVFKYKSTETQDDFNTIVNMLIIREMWIWIPEEQSYVHINPDEQDLMFELVKDMNEYDFQLITKFLTEYLYVPRFGAKTKCPNCGNDLVLETSIDELVFLLAQDITAEIQ